MEEDLASLVPTGRVVLKVGGIGSGQGGQRRGGQRGEKEVDGEVDKEVDSEVGEEVEKAHGCLLDARHSQRPPCKYACHADNPGPSPWSLACHAFLAYQSPLYKYAWHPKVCLDLNCAYSAIMAGMHIAALGS